MALVAGPATAQTTAVVRGSFGYHDLDIRPDRWDAGVLLDHYRVIAPDTTLNFGGFYLNDNIDTDANGRGAGYYEVAYKPSDRELFWRGRILDTRYFANSAAIPQFERLFSRDRTFDNLKTEQSIGALLLKDQRLAPYFEIGYANLEYDREIDPSVFSRDGNEVWAIGGVRVTIDPTFRIDLGARYNERWLQDPTISSHDSVFFDGKVVWTPREDLYVELNVDRVFLEPVVEAALFTESTTYSLLTIAQLDPRTRLKFEIGHIIEDQIGSPDTFRHLYGDLRLTYALDRYTELYASVLGEHSRNDATDLKADRVATMVGVSFRN